MATQKAVLGERLATNNVNYLFRKGNDICAVYERVANYGTANESAVTDLYTVDPTAMTLGNKIGGDIADSWFNWNYDAATERMYGLSEEGLGNQNLFDRRLRLEGRKFQQIVRERTSPKHCFSGIARIGHRYERRLFGLRFCLKFQCSVITIIELPTLIIIGYFC